MALEAAYSFDTDYSDASGNSRTITTTGNSAIVTGGQTSNALGKTGATMPVLPAAVLTACQSDDRTIMFDAKQNLTTWWVRFEKDAINSGVWGILNISGSMTFFARNAADTQMASRPTAASPSASAWHNYCVTYVKSTGVATFYYDGASVGTASFTAGTALGTAADRINICESATANAAMDNLRLYSHALTGVEVAATAGTPVTTGSFTDAGTATLVLGATGTQQRVAAAAGTSALTLGATGASGRVATASGSAALTLDATGAAATQRTAAGTAPLTLGATGASARVAADAGVAAVALGLSGPQNRVASAAGLAALTLGGDGAALHVATDAGVAALTLLATGVVGSGAPVDAGTALLTLGASGVSSAVRTAAGTAALVLLATGVVPAETVASARQPRVTIRPNPATLAAATNRATAAVTPNLALLTITEEA